MQKQLSEKSEVVKLIAELPEDSTIEEMQYHLYVLEKIRRGQADVAAGRVFSQDEVRAKFSIGFD